MEAPEAWLGACEAWPGTPEASLRASEALLGGGRDKQTYVRMDGQKNGRTHKSPYSIGHCPLQGCCPKNSHLKVPNDPKWPYRGRKWLSGAPSSLPDGLSVTKCGHPKVESGHQKDIKGLRVDFQWP